MQGSIDYKLDIVEDADAGVELSLNYFVDFEVNNRATGPGEVDVMGWELLEVITLLDGHPIATTVNDAGFLIGARLRFENYLKTESGREAVQKKCFARFEAEQQELRETYQQWRNEARRGA